MVYRGDDSVTTSTSEWVLLPGTDVEVLLRARGPAQTVYRRNGKWEIPIGQYFGRRLQREVLPRSRSPERTCETCGHAIPHPVEAI